MLQIIYKPTWEKEFSALQSYRKDVLFVLDDPNEKEIETLTVEHGLTEGHLIDALDVNEVPRIEYEEEQVYIVLRMPVEQHGKFVSIPVLFVVMEDFSVVVSKGPVLPTLEKLLKNHNCYTSHKIRFLIQLFGLIIDDYKNILNKASKQIKNFITDLDKIKNEDIIKSVDSEMLLNDFLTTLVSMRQILEKILQEGKNTKNLGLFEEDKDMFEDLYLSSGQLIDNAKSQLKYLGNLREAFSSIISNNLNKNMKFLTAITVLLMVPSIVTSFFGMNVSLPWQSHPYSYFGIILISLIIIFGLLYFFNKRDMLR